MSISFSHRGNTYRATTRATSGGAGSILFEREADGWTDTMVVGPWGDFLLRADASSEATLRSLLDSLLQPEESRR